MKSEYCSQCGSKVEATMPRPKFCANCGSPLGAHAHTSQGGLAAPVETEVAEGDEQVPNIARLQYDIDVGSFNKVKIESILGQGSENDGYKRQPAPDEGDPLKNAQNQCLSSRQPQDIGE